MGAVWSAARRRERKGPALPVGFICEEVGTSVVMVDRVGEVVVRRVKW